MGFSSGFLKAGSLSPDPQGYLLRIQLPWMRGLPFSSLVALTITLDGEVSTGDDISVELDGELVPISRLADRWNETWFMQRALTAHVRSAARPVAGATVTVTAAATLRIPYIIIGPNQTMVVDQIVSRELVAA